MIPPPVQFVTTEDGVRIAFTVCGEGPPLVLLTEPTLSHVELEWQQPIIGRMLRRLAERVTLVRLDVRATGLSDRVTEPGQDPVFAELDAVLKRLDIRAFALVGVHSLAPAAIVYATRHAGVTHLGLIDPALRVADMVGSPQLAAVITAAAADWTIASEVVGSQVFGVGRAETREFGAYVRSCIEPSFYRIALLAPGILDATASAPDVRVPTLVIRHAEHPYVTAAVVRGVAAAIPGAQMVTAPGLWADDPEGFTDRLLEWLLSG
jgi:pimeloyl-ACP methyl ester carboxylesterase